MRECKKERAGSSVGQATSLLFMAIAFAVACLMPAEAAAQKVNLRIEQGTTLDEAFRRIIKDSRVQLVYNTQEAAAIRCDGAHFRQQELRDVLQALLANTPLTYTEKEGIYTIVRKKAAPQTGPEKPKEQKLTGRVVDEQGEPLVGAAVLMKNEKQGTITDANGNFFFEHAPEEAVLVISYIGKVKIEQSVKPGRKNTFVMQEDENLTAEVVVTGYQTISKERATGAYSIVGAQALEQKPTPNLAQALNGLVPGLTAATTSVDGKVRFVIRGYGTMQESQADRDPLIVVDGFPISGYTDDNDPFSTINPDDVESVTVLKDAAATSIYGARAANGVIVITTRKGKAGRKPEVSANAYWSVSARADLDYLFNMASAESQFRFEELMNRYEPVNLTSNSDPYIKPTAQRRFMSAPYGLLFERDAKRHITAEEYEARKRELIDRGNRGAWKDDLNKHIFQRRMQQQYNVALRGSTEKLNYTFSASFNDEDSYLQGNGGQRVLLNLAGSARLSKRLTFNLAASTTFGKEQNNGTSISDIKEWLSPWTRLTDDSGAFTHIPTASTIYEPVWQSEYAGKTPADWSYNPAVDRGYRDNRSKTMNYRIQGGLDYKTDWGLNLSAKGQYEWRYYNRHISYEPESFYVRNLYNTYSTLNDRTGTYTSYFPTGGIFSDEGHTYEAYNLRGQADYSLALDKHFLTVLAGTEIISATTEADPLVTRYGFNKYTNSALTELDYVSQYYNIFGQYTRLPFEKLGRFSTLKDRFFSVYANASYTYDDRYSLTASFRTDASNFQADEVRKKFSPFWSVGGSWLVSHEDFMQEAAFVDLLKLRASYGIAGVAAGKKGTSSVTTVEVHPGSIVYSANEPFNTIAARGNDQLTWEKSRTLNVGLDVALFGNRLSGSFEFYNKYSYDVLAQTSVPVISQGTTSTVLNNAAILNRGVEFSIGTDLPVTRGIKWNGTLNYAFNHNEVKKYNYTGPYAAVLPSYVTGRPIGFITYLNPVGYTDEGYVLLQGKDGAQEAILDYSSSHILDLIIPGEGQTFEDNNWVYYLGSSVPTSTLSFSNSFSWEGLTLSFMITGQFGYYVARYVDDQLDLSINKPSYSRRLDKAFEVYDAGYANQSTYSSLPLYNDANYNGFQAGYGYDITATAETYFRNNYIKGDHIRLNEIYLGYDLPKRWLSRQGIFSRVNVYAQASNLGLIWSANGEMDPDYPVQNLKPMPTFLFGLRLAFKN